MRPAWSPTIYRRLTNGTHDPTTQVRAGEWWRTTYTPNGPATLRITFVDECPRYDAWGPGASILLDTGPALVGLLDTPVRVESSERAVAVACKRHWSVPLARTDDPYHELLPAILGQRITAKEATKQWYALCMRLGGPAPGPDPDLLLPPNPDRLATVAYHDLHPLGIERRRAEALIAVARLGGRLMLGAVDPIARTTTEMMSIRGVGPWTSAVAGSVAFGDPDAVPVGDFHLKNTVAWVLGGIPRGTDEEMLRHLEPFRGQRGRVLWWLSLEGWRAPRRGAGRRNLSVADL